MYVDEPTVKNNKSDENNGAHSLVCGTHHELSEFRLVRWSSYGHEIMADDNSQLVSITLHQENRTLLRRRCRSSPDERGAGPRRTPFTAGEWFAYRPGVVWWITAGARFATSTYFILFEKKHNLDQQQHIELSSRE